MEHSGAFWNILELSSEKYLHGLGIQKRTLVVKEFANSVPLALLCPLVPVKSSNRSFVFEYYARMPTKAGVYICWGDI